CHIRNAPVIRRKQAAAPAKKRSKANLPAGGDSARWHAPERSGSCQLWRGEPTAKPVTEHRRRTRGGSFRLERFAPPAVPHRERRDHRQRPKRRSEARPAELLRE